MRHRFVVALYSDVELEAEIADLLADMPNSRRQEMLRTFLKVGYKSMYQKGQSPSNKSEIPTSKGEIIRAKKDKKLGPSLSKPEKEKVNEDSHKTSSSDHKISDEISQKPKKEVIHTKKEEGVRYTPKDDRANFENETDDGTDIDPLQNINSIFEGL